MYRIPFSHESRYDGICFDCEKIMAFFHLWWVLSRIHLRLSAPKTFLFVLLFIADRVRVYHGAEQKMFCNKWEKFNFPISDYVWDRFTWMNFRVPHNFSRMKYFERFSLCRISVTFSLLHINFDVRNPFVILCLWAYEKIHYTQQHASYEISIEIYLWIFLKT